MALFLASTDVKNGDLERLHNCVNQNYLQTLLIFYSFKLFSD